MNCDYKILSGVIANRMKNILPDIIGNDQKGLSKIFISENTRMLYDIMDYLIHTKKAGLLLLIDFEQAFDSFKFYVHSRSFKKLQFLINIYILV